MNFPSHKTDDAQIYVKAFLEAPDRYLSNTDFIALLWNVRLFAVFGLLFGALIGFIGSSFIIPIYRSQITIEYVDRTRGGNDAAVGGALGGIASLAGINVGTSSDRSYALGRLKSQNFLLDYIRISNSKPILFASRWNSKSATFIKDQDGRIPSDLQAVARFRKNVVRFDEDKITQLITVYLDWYNPSQPEKWGNGYIAYVDRKLREEKLAETHRTLIFLQNELQKSQIPEVRAAIARLIQEQLRQQVLARGTQSYAFRIVDPAVISEKPIKPQRLILTAAAAFSGLLIGLLAGLIRQSRR